MGHSSCRSTVLQRVSRAFRNPYAGSTSEGVDGGVPSRAATVIQNKGHTKKKGNDAKAGWMAQMWSAGFWVLGAAGC
jgi:hypothetical protein